MDDIKNARGQAICSSEEHELVQCSVFSLISLKGHANDTCMSVFIRVP